MSALPQGLALKLVVSVVVIAMTSHHVVESVILRPNWFPYFRDRQSSGHRLNKTTLQIKPAQEHPQRLGLSDQPSGTDLSETMAAARAFNCGNSKNMSLASCYLHHTSLLLKLIHQNFYRAVSSSDAP